MHDAVPAAPRLSAAELAYVFDVILRQDAAVATYQAARYSGEIDLYVTDFESRRTDTLAYWESMHPSVIHSRHLPGDHAAVVELPGVARVARTIIEHVRSAAVALSDPRVGPSATYGKDWLPGAHARQLQRLARRSECDGTPG